MGEIIGGAVSGAVAGLVVAALLAAAALALKKWRRWRGICHVRGVIRDAVNDIATISGESDGMVSVGLPVSARVPVDAARGVYLDALRLELEAALSGVAAELTPDEKADIRGAWVIAGLIGQVAPQPHPTKELIAFMLRQLTKAKWLKLEESPAEPRGAPGPD